MVYCNHSALVILVNDAKYVHFYQTFQLAPTVSHCKYKPLTKTIEHCLFRYKYIIILSFNLSKYIQCEVFENCFKWVSYINTLFSPCSAWIEMKSCLNFCVSCQQLYIIKTGTESRNLCIVLAVPWSVKYFFAPTSPIFRITVTQSREEEEHRQLQKSYAFHENVKKLLMKKKTY